MDVVSTVKRSEMMSGIKGRNTRPEMQVRAYLHAQGLLRISAHRGRHFRLIVDAVSV